MRTFFLFVAMFCIIATAQSQDYKITFAGSGSTTVVETVRVANLTQGTTLNLGGSDVLHLLKTLGIGSPGQGDPGTVTIYPNPSISETFVEFRANSSGRIAVGVFDMNGRQVATNGFAVQPGIVTFRISGLKSGSYNIQVSLNGNSFSGKLVCSSNESGKPHINMVNGQPQGRIKSALTLVQMQYNDGDQLLFTCKSGNYTTIVPMVPTQNTVVPALFANCTDGSNNHYPVVLIGSQLWMEENLKTTRFNNGILIPEVTDELSWSQLSSPGMCWYQNDPQGPATYGGLYNGYAAQASGICPSGWRVPTEEEFTDLINFVGGTPEAGKKLKETGIDHWLYSINTSATNEYGFTALPAGYRHTGGAFVKVSQNGYWWGATPTSPSTAWCISMSFESAFLSNFDNDLHTGKSIRCIRE